MSFGTKLQEARKRLNLTQEQLAEKLDVTRQSISRWESDTVYPEMEKIVRLSDLLQVSCDYLLKNEAFPQQASQKSRLFEALLGKNVALDFYEDSGDFVFLQKNKKFKITDTDGKWITVEIGDVKTGEVLKKTVALCDIKAIALRED